MKTLIYVVMFAVMLGTAIGVLFGPKIVENRKYSQHLEEGKKYFNIKQWSKAGTAFEKAIKVNPKNPDGYYHRGKTHFFLKFYNLALRDFNKALELEPDSYSVILARANVFVIWKEHEKAIQEFTRAINMDKTRPQPFYNRGITKAAMAHGAAAGCEDWKMSCNLNYQRACVAVKKYCEYVR